MDIILIANIINGIGVFFLIFAHAMLSLKENKYNFLLSALGCIMVISGSLMLKSYPIIFLNIIWFIISISAFYEKKILPEKINKKYLYLLKFSFVIGLLFTLLHFFKFDIFNFHNLAAYQTTFIYIFSYCLFTSKVIHKKEYLIWSALGFLILIPHLVLNFQYSVLFSEFLGFAIAILGIFKIVKEENKIKEVNF